jgi:diguanylate cyclase (GGDEF)-like protein
LIYKQLAYEDYLTKGGNRTAFEQDIEKFINQGIAFRLVLLDLNHLKQINDTYGHTEGDYAIIESYNSLNETVKDNGKSYRISGDEFACIIYDTRNEIFEKFKDQVDQRLKERVKNKPYELVLAFGTKIYIEGENFTAFYKKVDTEMYKHKKMLKTRV